VDDHAQRRIQTSHVVALANRAVGGSTGILHCRLVIPYM
jgi:hypothetical protein